MKYICDDCGSVLDEDDLRTERSYVSDYMGGCYEDYSVCHCGGSVSEASTCDICGEYFHDDDLYSGVCEDCLKDEMTVDNAIKAGADAKLEVEINGFLASCFTPEQIEELLIKALEEKIDSSDGAANAAIDKAEEWLSEDKSWFADWLKSRANEGNV